MSFITNNSCTRRHHHLTCTSPANNTTTNQDRTHHSPVLHLDDVTHQTVSSTGLHKLPLCRQEFLGVLVAELFGEVFQQWHFAVLFYLVQRAGIQDGLNHARVVGQHQDSGHKEVQMSIKRMCFYLWWQYNILNPFSAGTHFLPYVLCDYTILLTLGRVYGSEKMNSQNLYYFHLHVSFWSCVKSTNNKQNEYENASSTEGVKMKQWSSLLFFIMEMVLDDYSL